MTFELLTPIDATMSSFSVRTEKHGEDDVIAFSMGLKISTANTFLDTLAPGLRESLYMAVPGQDGLPGVDPITPLLRCKIVDEIRLSTCFEGWTMSIPWGADEDGAIKVGGCRVDKWRVTPCEGGTVEVLLRIGSNDVDETELGRLGGKLGQLIGFTLTAPAIAKGEAIDGSVEAFRRDHPEFADQPDATDLFAAGEDHEGEPVQLDGEGDPDEFSDDEGASTDAGPGDDAGAREQAEIEAGMAQSVAAAGLKPGRGRRAAH